MFEVGSSVSSFTSKHIISGVTSPSKFKMKWEKTPQSYVTFCYVKPAEIIKIIMINNTGKRNQQFNNLWQIQEISVLLASLYFIICLAK